MSAATRTKNLRGVIGGYIVDLYVFPCDSCGLVFGVPEEWIGDRRKDGASIHCPNGHTMSYRETEVDREKKRAADLERRLANEQEYTRSLYASRMAERKAHAATKGTLTKTKKRIANGICPCCNRSFANLHRHMAGQHPDFAGESS